MRKHGKTDGNQSEIVHALRQVGASVQSLSSVGDGCVDLLVCYAGIIYLAEVKSANGKLTPDQVEWHDEFSRNATIHVWESIEDALRTIGAID